MVNIYCIIDDWKIILTSDRDIGLHYRTDLAFLRLRLPMTAPITNKFSIVPTVTGELNIQKHNNFNNSFLGKMYKFFFYIKRGIRYQRDKGEFRGMFPETYQ